MLNIACELAESGAGICRLLLFMVVVGSVANWEVRDLWLGPGSCTLSIHLSPSSKGGTVVYGVHYSIVYASHIDTLLVFVWYTYVVHICV
jgi:hypothetical protein